MFIHHLSLIMWLLLGVISALLIGFYDVSKKVSVNDNAVVPE